MTDTPLEIERKFILANDQWKNCPIQSSLSIRQGYLSFPEDDKPEVRVRISSPINHTSGQPRSWLTVKSKGGLVRKEVDVEIETDHAQHLLSMCMGPIIQKTRHRVGVGAYFFEIDIYENQLSGLMVAEIELTSPSSPIPECSFLGKEVTLDDAYKNSSLARYGRPSCSPKTLTR